MTAAFDKRILEEIDDDDDDQIKEKGSKLIDFQNIQSQLFTFYQNIGTKHKGGGSTPGASDITPGGPTPGGALLGMTPGGTPGEP